MRIPRTHEWGPAIRTGSNARHRARPAADIARMPPLMESFTQRLNALIEQARQIVRGLVTAQRQLPTPDFLADALARLGTDARNEVDEVLAPPMVGACACTPTPWGPPSSFVQHGRLEESLLRDFVAHYRLRSTRPSCGHDIPAFAIAGPPGRRCHAGTHWPAAARSPTPGVCPCHCCSTAHLKGRPPRATCAGVWRCARR